MTKRAVVLGSVLVIAGIGVANYGSWKPEEAVAAPLLQTKSPAVEVDVVTATRKMLPLRLEAVGTVKPVASVAIKPRIDTVITEVHVQDGGEVKVGDLLFTLDGRQIVADIKEVEANIAENQAQLEQAE